MVNQITEGIKVSVSTQYQPEYSSPIEYHYVFTYKVVIENCSEYTVRLLSRHWFIYDSYGTITEVKGEGVVGQQPVIEPSEKHQYVSGCNLKTEVGKMLGYYTVERLIDGKILKINIPEFTLIVPFKLN